jgi:hypothetical protein
MFGHPSLPTISFQFAAKEPKAGLPLVLDQLRAAHRYRNKLCELELERREEVHETVEKLEPRLAELRGAIECAKAALAEATRAKKAANAEARRHKADKALVAAEREARQRLKAIYMEEKALRAATFGREDVKAALKVVEERHCQEQRAARAESQLYWGTYLTIEHGCTSMRSGPPPKFLRWDGYGQLSLQIQGGLTWEQIAGGRDSRIRLTPPQSDLPAWHLLWFRIGSKEGKPVWTVVPVKITRKPPPTAKAKWAYLQRRVIGQEVTAKDRRYCHAGRIEWFVMFSMSDAGGWAKPDLADQGVVAINCGFRRVEGGLLHQLAGEPLSQRGRDLATAVQDPTRGQSQSSGVG